MKFHLSIFNTFRDLLQTNSLLQKLGREITVITCDRVIVLALCNSSDDILSMYQVLFNSEICSGQTKYCKNLIRKSSSSVNTGDRVLYFQRYAPDKLNIAKS